MFQLQENSVRKTLGNTNLEVSRLILGTMQMGWTATDVESMEILDSYVNHGGNFIDTANMYGGNQSIESFEHNKAHVGVTEDIIGRWSKARKIREKLIISTKVRARMWEGPDGEGLNRKHIEKAVNDSLKRLRTDYVDILYAHWPDPDAIKEEWLEVFQELIKSGKVRFAGSSNFCGFTEFGDELTPLLELNKQNPDKYAQIMVEQPRFNLLNRNEYEDRLQKIAIENNLGIVTYSSLASGFLAKTKAEINQLTGPRVKFIKQYLNEKGFALLDVLEKIAKEKNVPIASVSIAWILAQPGVTSAIIGPDQIEQLLEASYAPNIELTQTEIEELNAKSWQNSDPEFVNW